MSFSPTAERRKSTESDPLLLAADEDDIWNWRRRVHFSRWQSFAGVCLYVSVAGTTYAFGVYSDLLRTNLGFSQEGLDIVASVGNTGLYLSIFGGLLLERFGLQFVVYLGGLLIFIGFFYIWLAVEGYVPADIASVSLFFFVSQFGVCCHVSSAVTTAVRLFPHESRGSAVGLAKGYFGLSSAVLSDFSGGYFSHAKAYFILFIAIAIPSIGILGSTLANFIPTHMLSFEYEHKRGIITSLLPFFSHWLSMFSVLFVVGYSQYAYDFPGWSSLLMPTVLAVLVVSVLFIPGFYGDRLISQEEWTRGDSIDDQHDQKSLLGEQGKQRRVFGEMTADRSPKRQNSRSNSRDVYENGGYRIENEYRDVFQQAASGSMSGSGPALRNDGDDSFLSRDYDKVDYKDLLDVRVGMGARKDIPVHYEAGKEYGYGAVASKPEVEDVEGLGKKVPLGRFLGSGRQGYVKLADRMKPGVLDDNPECFFGDSVHLSDSIMTWRFWTLYLSFMTICGTGLMVIDNINAIAQSVNRHPSDFFVTLVSLANGAGRVSAGFASDLLSSYFSKLELLAAVAAIMGVAQSMFALGSPKLLYPSLLLVGFLFGCSVSLCAVNIADIFGPKYVATNFGAIDSAPIFGSYLFVTGVVAVFFKPNTIDPITGTESCVGPECFWVPFTINATFCFIMSFSLCITHLYTPMDKVIRSNRASAH